MRRMNTTVSTKYQIVIPKAVRKQLGIKPGQKMQVSAGLDGVILVQPDMPQDFEALIRRSKGIIKTADTPWGKAGIDAAEWLSNERNEPWRSDS